MLMGTFNTSTLQHLLKPEQTCENQQQECTLGVPQAFSSIEIA